jgi:hypothetical protein
MAPRWSRMAKTASRLLQDCFKIAQEFPRWLQYNPNRPQDGPKMTMAPRAPNWFLNGPTRLQHRPNIAQDVPERLPVGGQHWYARGIQALSSRLRLEDDRAYFSSGKSLFLKVHRVSTWPEMVPTQCGFDMVQDGPTMPTMP